MATTSKTGMPFRKNQAVALALADGTCPVGLVEYADSEWVSLTLYHWLHCYFSGNTLAVRTRDIERVKWADREMEDGWLVYAMDPLADFQTRWVEEPKNAQAAS